MKKIFLSEMKVGNSFYIYDDYELKGELFFSENNMNAILYEGYGPPKIIPLTKDLPLIDLFFKSPLYGENINGQIERIVSKNKQKKFNINVNDNMYNFDFYAFLFSPNLSTIVAGGGIGF